MRIHFICRGNVYRSLIAETYLKSLKISDLDVLSSGIAAIEYSKQNMPVIKFTLDFLKQKGIEKYAKTHWDQLTQSRLSDQDITICMNQRVSDECKGLFILPKNIIIWDIDDTGEGDQNPKNDIELLQQTEKIYQKIKSGVGKLVKSS